MHQRKRSPWEPRPSVVLVSAHSRHRLLLHMPARELQATCTATVCHAHGCVPCWSGESSTSRRHLRSNVMSWCRGGSKQRNLQGIPTLAQGLDSGAQPPLLSLPGSLMFPRMNPGALSFGNTNCNNQFSLVFVFFFLSSFYYFVRSNKCPRKALGPALVLWPGFLPKQISKPESTSFA